MDCSMPASGPAPWSEHSPSAPFSPVTGSNGWSASASSGSRSSLAVLGLLHSPGPGYPVAFLVGFFYFTVVTSLATVVQRRLDDAVRGRVMALWVMSFGGTVPLGAIIAGPLSQHFGIAAVVVGGAVIAVALVPVADLSDRRRQARPDATRRTA